MARKYFSVNGYKETTAVTVSDSPTGKKIELAVDDSISLNEALAAMRHFGITATRYLKGN